MKIASFRAADDNIHVGIVDVSANSVFDLTLAGSEAVSRFDFSSTLALIDGGDASLDFARELHSRLHGEERFNVPLAGLRFEAPLPEPRQMRDAMSFETHIRQGGTGRGGNLWRARAAEDFDEVRRIEQTPPPPMGDVYKQVPIYYITNRFSVRGHESVLEWPRYSKVMDYELEFGVVTTGRAKNVSAEQAGQHIFGFTIFNDFSARDRQGIEMKGGLGPTKGKSFDGGNVLGPWIVTPDEIGDPYSLGMSARINGTTVVQNTSRDMLFSFEEMIAYITQDETIMPGEFLGSGTVGNGCALENGYFLNDGDTIELEVEKIGILRNTVVRQPD